MKMTGQSVALGAAALLLLQMISACGDGGTKPPIVRDPRTILIPDEMDLEMAGREAVAGDTLLLTGFIPIPALGQTVTFRPAQTPLVIRGDKSLPLVTGAGILALLRFDNPRAGTRIDAVGFSGGSPAIDVVGSGEIELIGCRFVGGTVQVHVEGTPLTLRAQGNLMDGASLFGIDAAGSTHLIARQNTIVRAGDCGIRLSGASDALLTANLIWRSANFGIACIEGALLLEGSGCNDVVESAKGPYTGCSQPLSDFSNDPQFCDAPRGIYTLASTSPCAPLNSGGCGRIGARAVDCEPEFPATGQPLLPRESR